MDTYLHSETLILLSAPVNIIPIYQGNIGIPSYSASSISIILNNFHPWQCHSLFFWSHQWPRGCSSLVLQYQIFYFMGGFHVWSSSVWCLSCLGDNWSITHVRYGILLYFTFSFTSYLIFSVEDLISWDMELMYCAYCTIVVY